MQVEGTGSSSAATSNIHFGSISRSLLSASGGKTEDKLNYIYKEVIKLQKALESIEDNFRLRHNDEGDSVMSKTKADRIADLFKDAADALNNLFDDKKIETPPDSDLEEFVSNIRSGLKSAISGAFNSTSSTLQTDYGLTFDFGVSARRVLDLTSLDQNELSRKLTTDGGPVNELLFNKKTRVNDGLVEKMLTSLKSMETDLKDILGTTGVFINTTA